MTNAQEFIEDELAGIEGVRLMELTARAKEKGIKEPELLDAVRKLPSIRKRNHALPEGPHIEWLPWKELSLDQALNRLLLYEEWGAFFVGCAEHSLERFRGQVWQFAEKLEKRMEKAVPRSQMEYTMFEIASEELPDSPAGEDYRADLFKRATSRLYQRMADVKEPLKRRTAWDTFSGDAEELNDAWYDGTLWEFRELLSGRLKAASKTLRDPAT